MNPQALREALHDAAADTPVGPPPLAQIHRQASRTRRGRTATVYAAAAIVLVAGAATTAEVLGNGRDPAPTGTNGPVSPGHARGNTTEPESADVLGTWQIASMARYDVVRGRLTDEHIQPTTLNLTFTNQTWRVESGCPYLSGSYTLVAGQYQYRDPEFSSGSRCPATDYEDGNVANAATLIHLARQVTIADGHLYLHADDGTTILDAVALVEPTDWATNAKGDTYGIIKNDGSRPDLMYIAATNGLMGYAYMADLEGFQPTSPEDALEWQREHGDESRTVPVYESDGETVIGEHVISPGQVPSDP